MSRSRRFIAAVATLVAALGAVGLTTPALANSAAPAETPVSANALAAGAAPVRLAGLSRYETAVKVAQEYPAGQTAVFVTTGADFPDAISAAAVAGHLDAPVLLTPTTWVQDEVLDELRRLAPERIYVLGGPTVVAPRVFEDLAAIAPVERVYGINRYETSRKLVKKFFPAAESVILATGRGYADALAASAAAGAQGIPAILVDGTKAALDTPTNTLLSSLAVKDISIAGGHGAVSIPIEQRLRTKGFDVRRLGGVNRYETAVEITETFRTDAPTEAILATGEDFPDALTAAALAGQRNAAMYLTRPTCMPPETQTSLKPLGSIGRTIVGGEAVASNGAVTGDVKCPARPAQPNVWNTSGFTFSTTVEAPYFDRPTVNVHDAAIVLDATGLRVLNMGPGGSRVDHPVAFAQYGMSALMEFQKSGEQIWMDRALRHANRLVQIRSERAGAWYYPYLFDWARRTQVLKAPWWSAMAQGEALSLFVRLYEETGEEKWKTAADHTWLSFTQSREQSQPWATLIEGKMLWLEEYVGNLVPLKVLNGHIFALFGLYDYWKLTGDEEVLRYLDGAATSVLEVMPKIRIRGQVSSYCWAAECKSPVWQKPNYHVIHSWQLDTLARLTGDVRFAEWANILRRDWAPRGTRSFDAFMPIEDIVLSEDDGTVQTPQ